MEINLINNETINVKNSSNQDILVVKNNGAIEGGLFNSPETDAISTIGIGTDDSSRKNAVMIQTSGDVYLNQVGGYTGSNYNTSDKLQTIINSKYAEESKLAQTFVHRRVADGEITWLPNNEMIKKLYGKSVVWNQLESIPSSDVSKIKNGVTFTDNRDGSYTVLTEGEGASSNSSLAMPIIAGIGGHVYYLRGCPVGGNESSYFLADQNNKLQERKDTGSGFIATAAGTTSSNILITIIIKQGTIITTPIVFKPILLDLTLMFGAGNEPATVEEFEKMFSGSYYEYNPGTILNFKADNLETIGFNQWDEEWENGLYGIGDGAPGDSNTGFRSKTAIKVTTGLQYWVRFDKTNYNSNSEICILYYDNNDNYSNTYEFHSNSTTITIPNNIGYIRFFIINATTYNHDICINISDPKRNGTYVPYVRSVSPLNITNITGKVNGTGDSVKIFPNGLCSIGSIYDEITERSAIKNFQVVDLGSLTPTSRGSYGTNSIYYIINDIHDPSSDTPCSMMCAKYSPADYSTSNDKCMGQNTGESQSFIIWDSDLVGLSDDQLKTALSGVKLVYQLNTPKEYALYEVFHPICNSDRSGVEGIYPQNNTIPYTTPLIADIQYSGEAANIINSLNGNTQTLIDHEVRIDNLEEEFSPNMASITYSELKALRDNDSLVPGMQYCITDYTTTTTQTNTQSSGHSFDIIVVADNTNTLNEVARVIQHTGDTYFSNSKLNAWEIKYCLDNDTSKFEWADSTNGKGVIYWMKDERNNECGYDFKNIQFKPGENTEAGTISNVFYYTFSLVSGSSDSSVIDNSLNSINCTDNKIGVCKNSQGKQTLPFNVFRNIMVSSTDSICTANVLMENCSYNLFGNESEDNKLSEGCKNNSLGSSCKSNMLGYNSSYNILGNNCTNNIFGKYCNYNIFGFNCISNKLGSSCNHIKFGNTQLVKSYYRYINVGCGNQYVRIYCSSTTSNSQYYQNVDIKTGINYSDSYLEISDSNVAQKILTTYCPTDSQVISIIVPEENYTSYGIEFDITNSSPSCSRIGSASLHQTLPIQSNMRGCLLSDEGSVIAYLPQNDWTSASRDGSNGQVMVEIPEHYRKFETDGNKRRVLLSTGPISGYTKVPTSYVSAYEATLQRSTNKLASVVNLTADYRGGSNQSDWDGTYRSVLGRPVTQISRTNFRNYARNRKSGSTEWNCMTYDMQKTIYWLFAVEYATLNTQANYTSELTIEGYRQGGLGPGVSNWDYGTWSNFNGVYPFVPCGHTDSLGNNTGYVNYTASDGSSITVTSQVPRYHGIENPFGHIWQWTDGVNIKINPTEENGGNNLSEVYVCSNPANFTDSNYNNYTLVGYEARSEGYVKEIIFGEGGEIVPSAVGGSASTYFCDYHYTNIPTSTALRGLLFGGHSNHGSAVGLVSASSNSVPSATHSYLGSRLCFLPA